MPKISIRNGVFETNSSSTHSISICSSSKFDNWAAGNVYFFCLKDEFMNEEKMIAYISDYSKHTVTELIEMKNSDPEKFNKMRRIYSIYTYDEFFEYTDLETYKKRFTTEHGDCIVAFGEYGYDR